MMRGPKKSAMAVRNPAGEIVLEAWENETSKRPKFFKLPVVRGIFNFYDTLKLGYKCLMRSAEIAMPEEVEAERTEKEKRKDSVLLSAAMTVGAILGIALSIGLFIWLPAQLFTWISSAVPSLENRVLRSVFEGLFRIILFVGYVSLMCLMKDLRRTFEYHGAEHKTIFCYEAHLPLTVENIRKQRRFHPRCGTSFMILMLLVGIIISMFITITNPLLRTLIKLILLPITVGIGYELIKFCGRHDNLLTHIIAAPGLWLQRITVHEPDDSMIECAIAAMNEVIDADDGIGDINNNSQTNTEARAANETAASDTPASNDTQAADDKSADDKSAADDTANLN